MGFWVYMLIMVLLIPCIMTGSGLLFMKKTPGEINRIFGYRTKRSMKNQDTWLFAHRYIGKLWYRSGIAVLLLSVIAMIFLNGKNDDIVGSVGGVIVMLQMIPLIGAVFPTEAALEKNFDESGNPRSFSDH